MRTFPVSAIALFCEDIREEKSLQDTIIGALPDNLTIAGLPPNAKFLLPRLACFVRIHVGIEEKPKNVLVKLMNTDGTIVSEGGWTSDVIDKAFSDARTNGLAFVGLIQRVVVAPFPVAGPGKLLAVLTWNDTDYVIGVLNINVPGPNNS